MFLDAGGDGEDVRIEDDVLRREADFFGEDAVGARADFDAPLVAGGLPILVERHHDRRRAVAPHEPRVVLELLLAFLERDAELTMPLPWMHFRPGLDHAPLGRIDHDGHASKCRVRRRGG